MRRNEHKETLSSLHRKKMSEIDQEEATIQTLLEQIQVLERRMASVKETNLSLYRETEIQRLELQKEINRIKQSRMDYLLRNGELLFLHSESEKGRKTKIHGMQILKHRREMLSRKRDENRYYRRFRSNIDPSYVYAPESNINEDNYCYDCNQFKVLHPDEAITICEGCGKSTTVITNPEKPSMKDPPAENKQYEYKRYTHFCDWLANLQGKESSKVPDDIIHAVIREIAREKMEHRVDELNENDIKRYLKKYKDWGYDRYYDHATQILFRITDIPPLQMTPDMEQTLKLMFMEIQEPFELYKGTNRRNFSSYSYIIYKFCQLLEYNEFLPKLKLHKDKSKLYEHDKIWRQICNHLGGEKAGWKFIKS
jgi:hypothetical protein